MVEESFLILINIEVGVYFILSDFIEEEKIDLLGYKEDIFYVIVCDIN